MRLLKPSEKLPGGLAPDVEKQKHYYLSSCVERKKERKKPLSQVLFDHSGPANSLLIPSAGPLDCLCSFSESINQ